MEVIEDTTEKDTLLEKGNADDSASTIAETIQPLCGTEENSIYWMNVWDLPGIFLSTFVWLAVLFVDYVIITVVVASEYALYNAVVVLILSFLTLSCHARAMFTDPGTVPSDARPVDLEEGQPTTLCGRCNAYKPPISHHCRICNRCILRMDHHCPWMNNCVGAGNQKHFLLFLLYTALTSAYCICLEVFHIIRCSGFTCEQLSSLDTNLVRVLLIFSSFGLIFSIAMIINQIYGITTGIGTIDRMRLKKTDVINSKPIPYSYIFGSSSFSLLHLLPLTVVYEDKKETMLGFTTNKKKDKKRRKKRKKIKKAEGDAADDNAQTADEI